MNLTLSVLDDRQLEICNNGIDDDGNGKIDCQDRKCATSQFCTAAQCRPDAVVDPMPLNGTNVFRLVQTAGAGPHGKVPCATTPGGDTAVIELTLTAAADLKASWNQIGNHAFALYTDDGSMLPCDAGTLVTCGPAVGNNVSGMLTFTNVPQGRYYLIIAGDTAGASGSVNVALSGLPHP